MFNTTTTRNRPKAFSWSFSRLKNFENCPLKYLEVDVKKRHTEDNEQLLWGNAVHKALAEHLVDNKPLPDGMTHYAKWRDKLVTSPSNYVLLVEQQLAITKDLQPTEWFADNVWFRAVVDVAKISGKVALAADWKTGKILDDSVQLALTAQCIFSHHKDVQLVRSEYIWLKEDATTGAVLSRKDMMTLWGAVLPRVKALEDAVATNQFPAKPGGLCRKYCPVKSCQHNGV